MDHAGMEQDREDLARYRAGLSPLKRKEIHLGPEAFMTPEQVGKRALETLQSFLPKKHRSK